MAMMIVSTTLAPLLLIAGTLSPQAAPSEAVADAFVPEQVFAGRSEGKGELQLLLGETRPFTVASIGTIQRDGRLSLTQEVKFAGKAVQSRSWVMWRTSPGRYSATLTEAAGPVVARVEGSRLTLRYPLNRWGLVMYQTLDLTSDRKTLVNSGSIRFLGIHVGQLRETIQLKH